MSRNFLTVVDVAERWQCSQEYVRRLARTGQLAHYDLIGKGYRFTAEAVESFELESRNVRRTPEAGAA